MLCNILGLALLPSSSRKTPEMIPYLCCDWMKMWKWHKQCQGSYFSSYRVFSPNKLSVQSCVIKWFVFTAWAVSTERPQVKVTISMTDLFYSVLPSQRVWIVTVKQPAANLNRIQPMIWWWMFFTHILLLCTVCIKPGQICKHWSYLKVTQLHPSVILITWQC